MLIKGFIETSFVDWPGKVCSVIFLPYCNLRCPYCHNHNLVLNPENLESYNFDIKRIDSDWIDGICVSGGEPTLHKSLPVLLSEIKSNGFEVKLDTNGTKPEVIKYLIENNLVDYIAMDVKAPLDEVLYKRCSGVSVSVDSIRRSIKIIASSGIPHMFRCTVTPSLLTEQDIYRLAYTIKNICPSSFLHIQNFNKVNSLDLSLEPFSVLHFQKLQQKILEINFKNDSGFLH